MDRLLSTLIISVFITFVYWVGFEIGKESGKEQTMKKYGEIR